MVWVLPVMGLLGADGVGQVPLRVLFHVTPPRRTIIDAGARGDARSAGLLEGVTEIFAKNFRCSCWLLDADYFPMVNCWRSIVTRGGACWPASGIFGM